MEQLGLFPEEDTHRIRGTVVKTDRGWCAQIAGGWWTAYGSTRKSAISSVVRQYQKERDYSHGIKSRIESAQDSERRG